MNAIAERQKTPVAELGNFLEKMKGQLSLALPKHMNADRMARLALTAFSTTQALQECTHQSIAGAIMTAGQLGLEPGVNGAGFLIPYGKTCTFVPGWKGLVDLVSRSGRGTVYTGVVFKDQEYTYVDGARRDLVIKNETKLDAPEDITHAFAIGWVKDAAMPIIEFWPVEKIAKHRDKHNKVGKKHYSYRDWEMYCRKIPLLQVIKYMPASVELSNAIAVSNAEEMGHGVIIQDGIVVEDGNNYEEEKKEFYSDDQFKKNFPVWKKLIEDGEKTHDHIIKTAGSKLPLTDEQKKTIRDVVLQQEKPDGAPAITYAQVAEQLNKAKDTDLLDAAADLIGEIADEQQRKELGDIYNVRRLELEGAQS